MYLLRRALIVICSMMLAAVSMAGTLTVTSPSSGDFLGKSNTIKFIIKSAVKKVSVSAVVSNAGGTVTTITPQDFDPDSSGTISGSLSLNFGNNFTEGDFTITVKATEEGATYPDTAINVKVDLVAPKFLEISPVNTTFVRGIVPIRATIKEANIKDWTVQVNGQDLPGNSGTTNFVSVDWDTTNVQNDGDQTITINVRDKAGNTASQTIHVTLDRVKPILTLVYPRSDTKLVSNQTITVIVDIQDASSSSVDKTGVDVIYKRTDGVQLGRATLVSARSTGSNTLRWTGRITYRAGRLPSTFKIVVSAIDRAGNSAVPQEVLINFTR